LAEKRILAELRQRVRVLEKEASERKRAEKVLRETQLQYKEIFNAATDGFIIFDVDGNVVEANPQACKMHGYSRKKFVRLHGKDFVHPDCHYLFEQFQSDVKTKGEFQAESVDVHRKGTPFVVEVRGTEFDYQGRKHLLAILRDITERKQADEALRKSEAELQALSLKLISVQENEKKRLARELHDSLGQSLTAIKLGVENSLQEMSETVRRERGNSLRHVIPLIQRAIEDIRRVTFELRPSSLDNQGIIATIKWFCQDFQKICPRVRTRIALKLQENAVPPSLKITIYRVMQEAFTNIAKHSEATAVNVSLGKKRNKIELTIKDNGRGLAPTRVLSPKETKRGFGLNNMSERTRLSGGFFDLESAPGKGTTIRATWPCELP
jgi:PAS domain S-box-containing protein